MGGRNRGPVERKVRCIGLLLRATTRPLTALFVTRRVHLLRELHCCRAEFCGERSLCLHARFEAISDLRRCNARESRAKPGGSCASVPWVGSYHPWFVVDSKPSRTRRAPMKQNIVTCTMRTRLSRSESRSTLSVPPTGVVSILWYRRHSSIKYQTCADWTKAAIVRSALTTGILDAYTTL